MNESLRAEIERERKLLEIELENQEKARRKALEEAIKETTPNTGEVKVEDVKLPVNTNPKVLNVKFPYKEYGHLTLISNFDGQDNKHNKERYIYDDKMKIKDLADALGSSRKTIPKKLKTLEEKGILVKDPINPNVYKIKYTFDGKGDYIIIHRDILKKLVYVYNSETIAIYCLLCIELRKGPKILFRKEICEKIGLTLIKRNLDKVSSITESLENEGLISKESEYVTRRDERKEQVTYILATPEQYKLGIFRIRKAMKDKNKLEKKGIEI